MWRFFRKLSAVWLESERLDLLRAALLGRSVLASVWLVLLRFEREALRVQPALVAVGQVEHTSGPGTRRGFEALPLAWR